MEEEYLSVHEYRLSCVWEGAKQMSGEQLLWQTPDPQTVERKVQLALRDCTQATRALERLQACVEEALELSLRAARQYGDTAEEYRVQESRRWLDTEGKKIISSIRRKIAFADADTRLAMADSLTAAIESGQAAMERSLDDSENRYLLWQWADRILSSVQWAFESLPEGRILFHEALTGESASSNWNPSQHLAERSVKVPPTEFTRVARGFHFAAAA